MITIINKVARVTEKTAIVIGHIILVIGHNSFVENIFNTVIIKPYISNLSFYSVSKLSEAIYDYPVSP